MRPVYIKVSIYAASYHKSKYINSKKGYQRKIEAWIGKYPLSDGKLNEAPFGFPLVGEENGGGFGHVFVQLSIIVE